MRELGAAGPAETPSLTQKQRGIFSAEKFTQSCGTHTNNNIHSLIWLWNGPSGRDRGSVLPVPQDKQQTAYDIPNIFSSN